MIFKIEEDSTKQDIEILLQYAVMNEDVEKLISLLTSFDRITRILGIDDLLNKFPSELSGGEQQRVAIGCH